MTIALEPQTEANVRAVAELRQLSIEAYLTETIARDAQGLRRADHPGPAAELVRDGPFLVISASLPPAWNTVQAIDEMRAERDRQLVGL